MASATSSRPDSSSAMICSTGSTARSTPCGRRAGKATRRPIPTASRPTPPGATPSSPKRRTGPGRLSAAAAWITDRTRGAPAWLGRDWTPLTSGRRCRRWPPWGSTPRWRCRRSSSSPANAGRSFRPPAAGAFAWTGPDATWPAGPSIWWRISGRGRIAGGVAWTTCSSAPGRGGWTPTSPASSGMATSISSTTTMPAARPPPAGRSSSTRRATTCIYRRGQAWRSCARTICNPLRGRRGRTARGPLASGAAKARRSSANARLGPPWPAPRSLPVTWIG